MGKTIFYMLAKFKWLLFVFILVNLAWCDSYQHLEKFKYNKRILLSGTVSSIPKQKNDHLEFIFHTKKYGNVLLRSNKDFKDYLIPANQLDLQAKVYRPYEYDNFGVFSYSRYLDLKGIIAVGSIVKDSKIAFKGISTSYFPERLRYYLYDYLYKNLKRYQLKHFILALLIGDKNFNQYERNLLVSSGTSHLMVISGLHIGLLTFVTFILFRGLWSLSPRLCRKLPAQYIAVTTSVIVAFIYSFLAGFSLPTQRAIIMLLVVVILWLLKRRVCIGRSLLITFIIILLSDFRSLYSISLWLSFSAVIALTIIAMLLQQHRSKLISTLLAQIYLTIFLTPISVYYFASFSLVSILANLIAIPLLGFIILPLLFLCLILSFIGIKLWIIGDFLLKILYNYLDWLSKHVAPIEYWSYFSVTSLLIVVFGIFLAIFPFNKSIRLLGLTMCLVFFQPGENISKKYNFFEVHVFDTKKQMILIQNKGRSLLYICASSLDDKYLLSKVLKAYLKITGLKQIDYLVVFGKANKVTNLRLLRKIISVKTIITNLDINLEAKKCSYENNFSFKGAAAVKFLSYNGSCFVALKYGKTQFLLADNSNRAVQQKIYSLYSRIFSPKIIISSKLLYLAFIKNSNTKYFVYISNKLLEKSYYKLLSSRNVKIFDTYTNGAINIKLNNKNYLNISSKLKEY